MRYLRTTIVAAVAALLSASLAVLAQTPTVNSTLQNVFTLAWEVSTTKPSYSASVAGQTAVASATDLCSISGSATKVVRVRRIIYYGNPTAAAAEPISIVKRSTANTGAGATIAQVPYDSSYGAGTIAVAEVWTAAPTTGTLVGVLSDLVYPFAATGAGAPSQPITLEFGRFASPIVLRGAAQSIAVNLSGVTHTGVFGCTFEWTEE